MKWVTLICLLLCTIVTESRHLNKRDAEHRSRTIGGIYVTLGKENFNHILLVLLARNLQKCRLEENEKVIKEISAFAHHCAEHEEDEACKKPLQSPFFDHVCKIPHLGEGYPWATECCAKTDPDRLRCFHDHRDIKEEPFKRPDVDAACTEHKGDHDHALHSYMLQIARKHPNIYPTAVLELASQYGAIITECCAQESKEEKEKCFDSKYVEVLKSTYNLESKQKHVCRVLKSFPEKVYGAITLSKIAQQYSSADFEAAYKFALEGVHFTKDCCKGDDVECMMEKVEFMDYTCDNQEKLSANLKVCCDKPLFQRGPCMYALPKDEPPADLSKDMKEFLEDEHVCKNFADNKDAFLARFLFELSRRHPEYSVQTCLRVSKGYEGVLTKCCAAEHPTECLKAAPQLLEAGIKQVEELAEQNCDLFVKKGAYGYLLVLLSRYVPKMPQVTDATLLQITEKMTNIADKCCALPKNQRQPCGEEKLDILLGEMCERQAVTFINDQVRHCCVDSYADTRPCFTKLGADPSYKAPAFDESAFQVGADICEGTEDEQKTKRLKMLVHILKVNPSMPDDKKEEMATDFMKAREKCCAAENRQLCFDLEKPHMLKIVKESLVH